LWLDHYDGTGVSILSNHTASKKSAPLLALMLWGMNANVRVWVPTMVLATMEAGSRCLRLLLVGGATNILLAD